MNTGALRRATASRKRAVSVLTWSGVSQLRLKSMRPQGLRSSRKRSSASCSDVPAQPTMSAPIAAGFATRCSVAANQAVAFAGGDQRIADPRGRFASRNRTDAEAVAGCARYVRLADLWRQPAHYVAILATQAIIFGQRFSLTAVGGK